MRNLWIVSAKPLTRQNMAAIERSAGLDMGALRSIFSVAPDGEDLRRSRSYPGRGVIYYGRQVATRNGVPSWVPYGMFWEGPEGIRAVIPTATVKAWREPQVTSFLRVASKVSQGRSLLKCGFYGVAIAKTPTGVRVMGEDGRIQEVPRKALIPVA